MAEPELAGRTAERDAVRSFVDGLAMGSSALLIEGNEGIGKTTLWKAAVAEAERRGHAVLSARPARSEAQLSYSGLADLFLGRLDDLLPELPVPQAHALSSSIRSTIKYSRKSSRRQNN